MPDNLQRRRAVEPARSQGLILPPGVNALSGSSLITTATGPAALTVPGGNPGGVVYAPDIWDGRSNGQAIAYNSSGVAQITGSYVGKYGFFDSCTAHQALTVVAAPDGGSDFWFKKTILNTDTATRLPGTSSYGNACGNNSVGLISRTLNTDTYMRFQIYVPVGFPVINTYLGGGSAFCQIYETYGTPYGGAAPCEINIGDNSHFGYNVFFFSDHTGAEIGRTPKITYGVRHTFVVHQVTTGSGLIECWYDGVKIMSKVAPVIVNGVNDSGTNTLDFDIYCKVNCSMTPANAWPLTIYTTGEMLATTFTKVGAGA